MLYPLRWQTLVLRSIVMHQPVGCFARAALALGFLVSITAFVLTSKSQNSEKKHCMAFMSSYVKEAWVMGNVLRCPQSCDSMRTWDRI